MTSATAASTIEHELGSHGHFALRMPSGTASIQGVDGDVARVRDLTGRSLTDRFQVTAQPGVLELVPRGRFNVSVQIGNLELGGGPSADLVIELPRTTRVALDTASADVSVTGIAAPGRYRTTSGDLIIQDAGGDLEVEAVSGDLRIEAVAPIELGARTISGDGTIRAPKLHRLELTTTSGDLRVDSELDGKGPYTIKSISGDVTIVARGGLQIEAQTVTGDLTTDLQARSSTSSPGRKTLTIGRGGMVVSFKSVSGDLRVVEPRDAAPPMAPSKEADEGSPVTRRVEIPPLPAPPAPSAEADAARLEILRALERGEIDIDTATDRLAAVEEA
jgi:hypothetical protein